MRNDVIEKKFVVGALELYSAAVKARDVFVALMHVAESLNWSPVFNGQKEPFFPVYTYWEQCSNAFGDLLYTLEHVDIPEQFRECVALLRSTELQKTLDPRTYDPYYLDFSGEEYLNLSAEELDEIASETFFDPPADSDFWKLNFRDITHELHMWTGEVSDLLFRWLEWMGYDGSTDANTWLYNQLMC